jgi:hypothetical protein
VIENNRPPKEWPGQGVIKFKNYSVKYRDELDYVLKSINTDIKPGEKVNSLLIFFLLILFVQRFFRCRVALPFERVTVHDRFGTVSNCLTYQTVLKINETVPNFFNK